jgi:hypothetical protein
MATIKINAEKKIITKSGKVSCGCCVLDPCRDCPPLYADFNFEISGTYMPTGVRETFVYPPVTCCDPIRTCIDDYDELYTGIGGGAVVVSLYRAIGGTYNLPIETPCCWLLYLEVQIPSIEICGFGCAIFGGGTKIILEDDPRGVHQVDIPDYPEECCGPDNFFTYTVTIS